MDKAKVLKNSVFFSVFLVLVLASVYYVIAANPGTEIHLGSAGLPNATSTRAVSLSAANNINRSNMSGTVTFHLNSTITTGGAAAAAPNLSNVTLYYNATIGAEQVLTWSVIAFNNTFNLSTTGTNSSIAYIFVWNTADVTDSNQSVTINVTAVVNGTFKTTSALAYNITIDNTAPEVRLEGYAFDNAGVFFQSTHYRNNGTGIRFNFTALDTLQFLGTCRLFMNTTTGDFAANGSVAGSTDQLNVSRGTSTRITVGATGYEASPGNYSNANYVNLSDGNYIWNVQCNDTLGNTASNRTNFTLVIDTVAPGSVTLTVPGSNVEFGSSAAAEVKCDNSDALALTNDTVVTITKPGGGTVVKRNHNTTHASATFNFASGSDKELNELGTYKVDCAAKDRAGNSGSAGQKTFVVSSGDSGSGSSGGGGSGGTGGATYNLGTITSEGKTQLMAENGKATFTVAGSSHTATLTDVTADGATITVASVPVTLTLKVGETKKVDFETDAVYDLALRLVSIVGNRANFEFKAISESYTPTEEEGGQQEEGEGTGTTESGQETGKAGASKALWWILGLVVLVIVVALVLKATKKKKR